MSREIVGFAPCLFIASVTIGSNFIGSPNGTRLSVCGRVCVLSTRKSLSSCPLDESLTNVDSLSFSSPPRRASKSSENPGSYCLLAFNSSVALSEDVPHSHRCEVIYWIGRGGCAGVSDSAIQGYSSN